MTSVVMISIYNEIPKKKEKPRKKERTKKSSLGSSLSHVNARKRKEEEEEKKPKETVVYREK